MGRLRALYGEVPDTAHAEFWLGVAAFLRKPRPEWLTQVQPQSGFLWEVAGLIWRGLERGQLRPEDARTIFEKLVASDDLHLAPFWLRRHFVIHGLFGWERREGPAFLTAAEAGHAARSMARAHRELHLQGNLLPALWAVTLIFNMSYLELWDDACRRALDAALEEDAALDGFTLLFFGRYGPETAAGLEGICDHVAYAERATARLADLDEAARPSLVAALRKAVGEDS